jgi:serine/threonine-protein kinase
MTTSEPQPEGDPAQQCSSCGTIQQGGHERCRRCEGALMPARLPAVLAGTFAVECEIGHGGMGVVYRGRDLRLDRLVALKTLPRVSVSSVSRLRQEALAMAALQDPHLAVIYGAEQWRGSPVLILEYLAGGTLGDRLRIGSLTADEVIELGLAMSSALHTLHRAGFLHRDVKPSNIGYTSSGVPKLLDFGLAKLVTGVAGLLATSASTRTTRLDESIDEVEARPALTQSRHLAGTLAYMSPEAIALSPPVASFDLWGLAVTLLEALIGRNPFLGGDLEETFHLIRLAHVPDLQSFESPALTRFFATALSTRRDERPRSARAFRDALARCRNV